MQPLSQLVCSDRLIELHEALKPFIQWVHSSVKFLEASFSLVGHLLHPQTYRSRAGVYVTENTQRMIFKGFY